jgi:DNA-directed RNA polymerase subunit RPC12/RpoP
LSKGEFKCDGCGQTFATRDELEEHAKAHMSSQQEFYCQACGKKFETQEELAEHGREAHPMPAR